MSGIRNSGRTTGMLFEAMAKAHEGSVAAVIMANEQEVRRAYHYVEDHLLAEEVPIKGTRAGGMRVAILGQGAMNFYSANEWARMYMLHGMKHACPGCVFVDHFASEVTLERLAADYRKRTEEYDRTVCTGPIRHGGIQPASAEQHTLINRNAKMALHRAQAEGLPLGVTAKEVFDAVKFGGNRR